MKLFLFQHREPAPHKVYEHPPFETSRVGDRRSSEPTPENADHYHRWDDPDLAATYQDPEADPSGTEGAPGRFVPWVCVAVALFAMVIFSVVREIQHNRELYRMSQRVEAAEAQRRECLQELRMAEAREASLQAELHGRPFLTRNLHVLPAEAAPLN